jgi:hypothetical protein
LHLQEPSLLPAQFPDWSLKITLKNDQGQGEKAYKICQNYQKDKACISRLYRNQTKKIN